MNRAPRAPVDLRCVDPATGIRYHGRMGFTAWWRQFRAKRRRRREARRLLAALFDRPDIRVVSSLRPDHRSRAVLLGYEGEGGDVTRLRFGIVRHPRPMPLRGVHHEVIEVYRYDVRTGKVEVVSSHNVTRRGAPGRAPPADERRT